MTDAKVPHYLPRHRDDTPVILTGADLTVADVEAVARHGVAVELDVHARERMEEARAVIDGLVAEGAVVYGVTTGFGDLASTFIPGTEAARLQEKIADEEVATVNASLVRSFAQLQVKKRRRRH